MITKVFKYCLYSLLFLLISCASPKSRDTAERLLWPPQPMEAKIEWVRDYEVLTDTASRRGFWGRVGDFFLGPKSAHILRPYGVCTDGGTTLFVADAGGGRVHIFDMVDERYSVIEKNDLAVLVSPIGLAYADDFLLITDSFQGRVFAYSVSDKSLKPWSSFKFKRPTGIAYDARSHLFYVSDTTAHKIIVLDRNGVEQFRFGRRGKRSGEFNFPTDLWFDDATGNLYVTDSLNARIQIFSGHGEFIGQFGRPGDTPGKFSKPKGIAVDSHGHIFVCDALFDAVQIFDQKGRILLSFGDNGHRPGQFSMPSGIFIDKQDYIYVTDTYNRRIQVFKELDDR